MKNFNGVITPILTPFTKKGKIYRLGFRNLFKFLKSQNINGIFGSGSYGSFPLLDVNERLEVIKIIIEESKRNNLSSIIHVGHADTNTSIKFAKFAANCGADAIAAVIPYYYSGHAYDEKNIISHFKKIRDSVKSNLHFYNNPRTTKVDPSLNLLKKIHQIGFNGMKDSGSDIKKFKKYANLFWKKNKNFDLMPGSGSLFLKGFNLGARACVAGTSMAFPKLVVRMYNEILSNDLRRASITQKKTNYARILQGKFNMRPASAYDILAMQDVDVGYPRLPWRKLSKKEFNFIRKKIFEYKLV